MLRSCRTTPWIVYSVARAVNEPSADNLTQQRALPTVVQELLLSSFVFVNFPLMKHHHLEKLHERFRGHATN